jgi:hypothetical protein
LIALRSSVPPLIALRSTNIALALWFVLAASGCTSGREIIVDCRDVRDIHPICGLKNPEDMSLLEDGHRLIVSQYGSMTDPDAPGSLALLDLETEQFRVVYPIGEAGEDSGTKHPAVGWGDPDCPGPAIDPFNPHGIDLARRADGRLQLLAVNHGGGESIEFFEVLPEPENVHVVWRGCVVAPEGGYFNDIVHLPGGGFLVTHMMDYGSPSWGMIRALFGSNTGFVYEWQAADGFRALAGTEAPFPNGIEVSEDGSEIFVNVYLGNEVRRIARDSGETLATAEVPSPDNLSWAKDGRLLVASHLGGFSEQRPCMDLDSGACPMSFEIRALDPESLEGGAIFANAGPPMGGGTVAIDVGGELVMGSFAGDRVIRVRIPRR